MEKVFVVNGPELYEGERGTVPYKKAIQNGGIKIALSCRDGIFSLQVGQDDDIVVVGSYSLQAFKEAINKLIP